MDTIQQPISPVTIECVIKASTYHKVPLALLVGILRQEDGRVGKRSFNQRVSKKYRWDYGPMQINSHWEKMLNHHDISLNAMKNHGCANIFTGAWILSQAIKNNHGNKWMGVGEYHTGPIKQSTRDTKNNVI